MEMSEELKAIMQRRLERSENNPHVAFVTPRKSTLKPKSPPVTKMKVVGDGSSAPINNYDKDGTGEASLENERQDLSHQDLEGKERLCSVVQLLGKSCPWTKSIASKTMLKWLRSELDELEKELDILEMLKDKKEFDFVTKDETNENVADDVSMDELLQSLTSEMGDILFDALMLEMIVRREYDLAENSAWDAASEKIERRTPYMENWGDGKTTAETPEEATVIWNAVKSEEKKLPLPSFVEKNIIEQKNEVISDSGLSDEIDNQSATQNSDIEVVDETQEEDHSIKSTHQTDAEENDRLAYPSDEHENSNDNERNDVERIAENDEQPKKEEHQNSIIEKKDSFPILNSNFVRITGLQKFNEINALTSASLGFAAGALIVTLLQKIRFR